MKELKAWAVIDTQKKRPRWCYEGQLIEDRLMAVYDKKPKIHWRWKPFKKVIRVTINPHPSKTECSVPNIDADYDEETMRDIHALIGFALKAQKEAIIRAVSQINNAS
jgi:hypothetical protein